MSENPYSPPASDLGASQPASRVEGTGDFSLGECLSDGWANCWANFPLWLGVGIVATALALLAAVTVIGIFLVIPVLGFGATLFGLRMHDGNASFSDLFAGFRNYGAALAPMLAVMLVLVLVSLAGQSVQMAGDFMGNRTVVVVGFLVNIGVSFMVGTPLNFAYFYVVDQGCTAGEALSLAWSSTRKAKWKIIGLIFLGAVVSIAGLLALVVGIIPAAAIVFLMWVSAFRQIAGRPA